MLQATDVTRFRPVPPVPLHVHDVAVVAKSRDVFRASVADAIAGGIRPAIYGSGWEPFVDPALVVSDVRCPTRSSPSCTRRSGVLLNDHWQTMHEWGFVSNRLFDALACETPVISDDLPEIAGLFDGAVLTYRDAAQLRELIVLDARRSTRRPCAGRARTRAGRDQPHLRPPRRPVPRRARAPRSRCRDPDQPQRHDRAQHRRDLDVESGPWSRPAAGSGSNGTALDGAPVAGKYVIVAEPFASVTRSPVADWCAVPDAYQRMTGAGAGGAWSRSNGARAARDRASASRSAAR